MIVLRLTGIDGVVGVKMIDASSVAIVARESVGGDARFKEMVEAAGLDIDPSELLAYIEYDECGRLGIPVAVADFKVYADGALMLNSEDL